MFGTAIIEVGIGLALIYLILSSICSVLQELYASFFSLRSATLEEGIQNLLDDPNVQDLTLARLSQHVYAHPLVKKLGRAGAKPSYVPARNFALALLDTIRKPDGDGVLASASQSIERLPDGQLKKALGALLADAEGGAEKVRLTIEKWFDDAMDRVSGWYKRKAQAILLATAASLAVVLNVDSIEIGKRLWRDPTVRQTLVEEAEKATQTRQGESGTQVAAQIDQKTIGALVSELEALPLPVGWVQFGKRWKEAAGKMPSLLSLVLQTLAGWTITTLTVSLGAPFWFDALGKALGMRASGRPPARAGG